jgi:hypothetical protein
MACNEWFHTPTASSLEFVMHILGSFIVYRFQIKASWSCMLRLLSTGVQHYFFFYANIQNFLLPYSIWKTYLILNILSGCHMKNVVDMHPQIKIKCFPVARTGGDTGSIWGMYLGKLFLIMAPTKHCNSHADNKRIEPKLLRPHFGYSFSFR